MSGFNRKFRRATVAARKAPEAQRFAEVLRRESARLDDHEYMAMLEADNTALHQWRRKVQPRIANWPEMYEARRMAAELRTRIKLLETQRTDVEELPSNLLEVINLAERLYPDRLAFADTARKSAREASFQDIHIAWRMLRSMALSLHGLYETSSNIPRDFCNLTGFGLALTESSATRADPELIRERLVNYGNRLLYAEGHVKYGNRAPHILRVHYVFPEGSPQIVISHVGDHLETAGTRRGRGR